MALKLQYYGKEGTIRSVGSEPNGILIVGGNPDDGAQLSIHPTVSVPAAAFERNVLDLDRHVSGLHVPSELTGD